MAKKPAKKVAKKPAKKAAKKAAKKPAKKAAKKAPAKKTARKPNAALLKPYQPSAALGEIIGNKPMPRSEVVKKLWVYIKANGLQDKKNRRMINADAKLKPVFSGLGQVSMFEMGKHLSKHLK
ncbi:MAG TPA: SWIB/MDM2 domain-containing protein [Bacteroidia bacterium]|jgi:chromatin remodeling complex protein RSC6|nr:SWIB/MDM2 domain-containing protein [Bacteroidia bacterium]